MIGTARDGLGLYGPRGPGGRVLRNRDLDACHGHTHRIGRQRVYHYHVTREFPYTIGCFRRAPRRPAPSAPPVPVPAPAPQAPAPTVPAPSEPAALTADPPLSPAFDPAVPDYAIRCDETVPVVLSTAGPATVALDGGEPRAGVQSIQLDEGEGFSFMADFGAGPTAHHARCLPEDFPKVSVQRNGPTESEFVMAGVGTPPYAMVFDANGVPVWWMKTQRWPLDVKLLPNGDLAWIQSIALLDTPANAYEVRRLDGTLVTEYRTVGTATDQHEFLSLPNGNVLLMSYKPRDHVDLRPYVPIGAPDNADATVLDAEIQELRPDGSVAWSWNSAAHIGIDETTQWDHRATLSDGRVAEDIVHANSLELDGDGILMSARHTDSVYRIDRATGQITWKLGGTTTPQTLTPLGDASPDGLFSGQHDARVLPDNTITVHENGTFLDLRPPRALRFAIDPAARTATVIEQFTDQGAPTSFCCGSSRRLPGGSWLAGWGGNPRIVEGRPGQPPSFVLTFETGGFSYRAFPVLPGVLARTALRAGMDAMP
jgi:hypothetical protein